MGKKKPIIRQKGPIVPSEDALAPEEHPIISHVESRILQMDLPEYSLAAAVAVAGIGHMLFPSFFGTKFDIGRTAAIPYVAVGIILTLYHLVDWLEWYPLHVALQRSRIRNKKESWDILDNARQQEIEEARELAKRMAELVTAILYSIFRPSRTICEHVCFVIACCLQTNLLYDAHQKELVPKRKTFEQYAELWKPYGMQGVTWLNLMWWLNNIKKESSFSELCLWFFLVIFHTLALLEGVSNQDEGSSPPGQLVFGNSARGGIGIV
ncbi:hypothetical protein QBC44DRAFT_375473 [Cladorrhinum sp. PSN332]|nr:hypothetical protein QBC44DRAFT_375473 [Cladorrhinum sp. PSN332]